MRQSMSIRLDGNCADVDQADIGMEVRHRLLAGAALPTAQVARRLFPIIGYVFPGSRFEWFRAISAFRRHMSSRARSVALPDTAAA